MKWGVEMDRRSLLISVPLFLVWNKYAFADDLDTKSVVKYAEGQISEVTLGKRILPPDDPRWKEAYDILEQAPKGKRPYEIAEYFKQSVPPKFQRAWPESDANPIIVEFFFEMHDTPAGDTTPWCAAFVNWCLRHSGIKGTDSAGSQSFINTNWGREVWRKGDGLPTAAKTGDIAVFRHQSDPAHGHVAFFNRISPTQPGHVDVLGGNQLERLGGQIVHLIDFVPMRIEADLELFSVRTEDGLRV